MLTIKKLKKSVGGRVLFEDANMVINYGLPLMNERDRTADERPDIETYIHRLGT